MSKINLGKKLTALLLSASFAFTLSSCAGKVKMNSISPKQLLSISDVADDTFMDELTDNGTLVHYGSQMNIVDAAEQLEHYLDIIDQLKDIDFSLVSLLEPLSEEELASVTSLSASDINALIEQSKYKGKNVVEEEKKLNALKKLNQLNNSCTEWVHHYGQSVSISYMMAAVKCALADELNLPLNQYENISICGALPKDSNDDYTIDVNGKTYTVKWSADAVNNAISYIHAVQAADLTEKTEYDTYRKALNYGKTAIAAAINIDNKDRITSQNSDSYIEKVYVKQH